jgi:Short C-terminal domain
MAATMVGGTAYVASKAGARAGAAQAAQQSEAAAAQQAQAAPQPVPVAQPVVEESMEQKMDQLAKLKQLLDMGAVTQEEYEAKRAPILASM